MPILVYSGFGTSNMLTAGRNLGSITTGIDRFVLTYSLSPLLTRTVPRLLREKKTHDQHFERGQPNCHALRLFLFLFFFFYIFLFREQLRARRTWCTKIPTSCPLNFFPYTENDRRLALFL